MDRYPDMLMYGKYIKSICIRGKKYPVNFGFRDILRIISAAEEGADEEDILKMFWKKLPSDRELASAEMKSFIGEEYYPAKDRKSPFSFSRDAGFIIGAFEECYGIDLTVCDMHWHRFCALFSSLPADCAFSRLIVCRTARFSSAEEKLAARRITRKYGG